MFSWCSAYRIPNMSDEEKREKPARSPPGRLRRFFAAICCCFTLKTTEETEMYVPPGFHDTFTAADLREARLISWVNGFLKDERLHIKKLVDLARGAPFVRFVEGLFGERIESPADRAEFYTRRGKRRRKLEKRAVKAAVVYLQMIELLVLGEEIFENLVVDIYKGNHQVIKALVMRLSKHYLEHLQKRSQCIPGQDPHVIYLPQVTCRVPALSPTAKRLERRLTKRDVLWDLHHKLDVSNESMRVNVELIKNIRNEWRFIDIDETPWGIYQVGKAMKAPQGSNLGNEEYESSCDGSASSCIDLSFDSVADVSSAVLEDTLSDPSFASIEGDQAALDGGCTSSAPGLKKVTSYMGMRKRTITCDVEFYDRMLEAIAKQLVRVAVDNAVLDLEAGSNASG